jgi:hypothetical protein
MTISFVITRVLSNEMVTPFIGCNGSGGLNILIRIENDEPSFRAPTAIVKCRNVKGAKSLNSVQTDLSVEGCFLTRLIFLSDPFLCR